jgi:hypothetical protein
MFKKQRFQMVDDTQTVLKVRRFEPEYLGKLGFYLEALDRDVRKPHEQPAIGVLLCASKDDEVVEYALSRTLSPPLIAEYQTQLPDKKLLQAKLHEFYLKWFLEILPQRVNELADAVRGSRDFEDWRPDSRRSANCVCRCRSQGVTRAAAGAPGGGGNEPKLRQISSSLQSLPPALASCSLPNQLL